MGGKSWNPWVEVVVTKAAGEHWASRFPRLALWTSYRSGFAVDRPYGVAVVNRADGVAFVVKKDGERWMMMAVEATAGSSNEGKP